MTSITTATTRVGNSSSVTVTDLGVQGEQRAIQVYLVPDLPKGTELSVELRSPDPRGFFDRLLVFAGYTVGSAATAVMGSILGIELMSMVGGYGPERALGLIVVGASALGAIGGVVYGAGQALSDCEEVETVSIPLDQEEPPPASSAPVEPAEGASHFTPAELDLLST